MRGMEEEHSSVAEREREQEHQRFDDRTGCVEVEDISPAKVLNNERTVQWAHHPPCFGDSANNTQRKGKSLFAVEIAHNGHRYRYDSASPDSLDKASGD